MEILQTNIPAAPTPPRGFGALSGGGRYFDGKSTQSRAVDVRFDGTLMDFHFGLERAPEQYALADVQVAERSSGVDLVLGLPNGASVWLDGAASALSEAIWTAVKPRQRVARLIASWPAVAACLLILIAFVVWFDRHGAGWLAQSALPLVPKSVDIKIGEIAMSEIEKRYLDKTGVAVERSDRIAKRFNAASDALAPDWNLQLNFRRMKDDPRFVNAFALPGGQIILFDGLTNVLNDDEVLAVLGHELGHVVHRDGIQSVLRSVGLATLAGVFFGDFSTVAAGSVTTLQELRYSRDAERNADAFARQFVQRAGLSPAVLASAFKKLEAASGEGKGGDFPDWLSTHPPMSERQQEAVKPAN